MPASTFKIFAPLLKTSMGADGQMRLHGVASSTIRDRHGDTMQLTALRDMERSAAKGMTIFLNHSYDVPEDVAGTVERAAIGPTSDPEIWDLNLDIIVNKANDRAVKTWEAIDGGTKLGLSIGAMIPDGGATRDRKTGAYDIAHVELLETSLVGVPANPRSWVEYAVKSIKDGALVTHGMNGAVYISDGIPSQPVEYAPSFSLEIKGTDLDAMHDYGEADPEPEPTEEDTEANPTGDARVAAEDAARVAADEAAGVETGESSGESSQWSVGFAPHFTTTSNSTDLSNATVSISTPYADINIDTGRSKPANGSSQEALESAPETEDEEEAEKPNPWAAIGLGETEMDLTALLEPTVVASLKTSTDLLQAITRELIDTKAALASVTEERDAVAVMAQKAMKGTQDILDRLSLTPVGRRTVVKEANDSFASLSSVYSDAVLSLLKKG